jgi:hypothetical protein
MVLMVKIRRGLDNDSKDFIPAYKKLSLLDKRRIKQTVGDKGYNDERNHRFSREELGAYSIIPARKNRSPDYRTTGKYRREMRSGYLEADYHQRSKMETINSVIKRRMGSTIRARLCGCQNREILFRVFAYNIEKGILRIYIEGFLESLSKESYLYHWIPYIIPA